MILSRDDLGPLPSRAQAARECLERWPWGSLRGPIGESPGVAGGGVPARAEDQGDLSRD